jgi:hypothetical protein
MSSKKWNKRGKPTAPKVGRKKGQPNLKKTNGGYVNQHGVFFSEKERKEMEKAVNRSNYRRKKMMEEYKNAHPEASQLRLMGKEPDFMIPHQKTNLQRFTSKADFESYLGKQSDIQSGKYLDDMTRLYKRNHMKAIDNVFGDAGKDIKMKIRMMKPEEYREFVKNNEFLEISYVYDPNELSAKMNKIRAELGMRLKENDLSEEEY